MYCRVFAVGLGLVALTPATATHAQAVDRLGLGAGTVLIIADDSTGLDLWAARHHRPGERRAPDFVGWFDPDSVAAWIKDVGLLVRGPAPDSTGAESGSLEALDGGYVAIVRLAVPADSAAPYRIAFGHRSERSRWAMPASTTEVDQLLAALAGAIPRSLLASSAGLGYANPTNRRATPDRRPESGPPAFPRALAARGVSGEVWVSFEIDSTGRSRGETLRFLWSDHPELVESVRRAIAPYRYSRHDRGRPARLRVYQRFRFTAR